MKEKNYVASVRQDSNDNCDAPFNVQNTIEQLKIIYDDLQSNIDGCYVNLNESGLSQKEKGFFLGCASVCMDMKIKIAPLLNSGQGVKVSDTTESASSTEADKPQNSPVKEDWKERFIEVWKENENVWPLIHFVETNIINNNL